MRMDLYGERRNAKKTIVFLCAIVLAFLVADLLEKDVPFSKEENRSLQMKPKFTWEALLSGNFMEDYETYINDQFIHRENWILIQNVSDLLLQKKEKNGVYLGKDDTLIEQHLPGEFSREQIEEKLGELMLLLADFPQAKVMLVPTADAVMTEKLPAFAPCFDQEHFLQQVEECVGQDRMIDVYSVLRDHAEEELYYRTDSHWTTKGAYYGYEAFAKAYPKPVRWYLLGQTVKEDFQGDLYARVGLHAHPEAIHVFPRVLEEDTYRISYDGKETQTGFYEEEYLKGQGDYGFFLDGAHGLVEIERDTYIEGTLLVIKDSYANAMIPLLAHHYKKIYVVDLDFFDTNLAEYMQTCEKYDNMDVLVLYNCIDFIENFQYP